MVSRGVTWCHVVSRVVGSVRDWLLLRTMVLTKQLDIKMGFILIILMVLVQSFGY